MWFIYIITDVVSIEKTNELFRLIYDVKGRFTVHRITPEEAKVSICKKTLYPYIIVIIKGLCIILYFSVIMFYSL